jgi:hypothetical protein
MVAEGVEMVLVVHDGDVEALRVEGTDHTVREVLHAAETDVIG